MPRAGGLAHCATGRQESVNSRLFWIHSCPWNEGLELGIFGNYGLASFVQEETPKRAQIVEQTTTDFDVLFEFFERIKNYPKGLTAARHLRIGLSRNVGQGILLRRIQFPRQKREVFPGTLDIVKRPLELVVQEENTRFPVRCCSQANSLPDDRPRRPQEQETSRLVSLPY